MTIEWGQGQHGRVERSIPRLPRLHWLTMTGVWVIVFLLVWTYVRPNPSPSVHNPQATPRAVTPRGDLTAEENATIKVFREAAPSVVYITATDLRRDLFGFNVFEVPAGTGSCDGQAGAAGAAKRIGTSSKTGA